MHETQAPVQSQPWWKFGHVWLVIAGPVIVVIAGFITLWLAIRTPDPVVTSEEYRRGMERSKSLASDASNLAPAVQARNHAQTGVPGTPAAKP
jgi:hypothetical protein